MSSSQHWDGVYATTPHDQVSWYEDEPRVSLRLLASTEGPVVDVGAGCSRLPDRLLDAGREVTLLDVSEQALSAERQRLGPRTAAVSFVVADVLTWQPDRAYGAWHDRAVFHFLVDAQDQRAYADVAASAVRGGGAVVLGAFATDGPMQCSGLPTTRWDPDELAAVFAEAFSLEACEREEHVTPGGQVQPFTWVVLRRRTRD